MAEKIHLTADLEQALDGNRESARNILTIAMFSWLSRRAFSHLAACQRYDRHPAVHRLIPDVITRLSSCITEQNRMNLFRLRRQRLGRHEFVGLILISHVKYVWQQPPTLRQAFPNMTAMLKDQKRKCSKNVVK